MYKLAPLLVLLATACAPETSQSQSQSESAGPGNITYGGGDGSSCEKAVIVQGAKGEMDGVGSEYAWLKQHYPGSKSQGQSLTECQGKPADKLHVLTADGKEIEVYFDISQYFGKM